MGISSRLGKIISSISAFTFEEKPKGLKEVSVGDKVIVKYTGSISMVDPFMGEILSVERQ
ncbi:MAG: hypothetical protein J6L65_06095 [Lachnospiraceae bacterium]|nr:hypothetical protein [Lachnospiraceae bacterium]